MDAGARQDEAVKGKANALDRKLGGGADAVGQGRALRPPEETLYEFLAELFPPGAFGWPPAEVGMAQQAAQQEREGLPTGGEAAAAVVAQTPAGAALDHGINHHVARAGVEGEDFLRGCVGGDHSEVGNAAEVERHASTAEMAIEQVVHVGHQRCALAAGGEVAGAEVGHHCNAGALGDHCRLAQL